MSSFFVRLFKRENKCPHCAADKLSGYSLCATHLEQAKLKWRSWATERREHRLCCYCDRKSFRGWLRCRAHTIINRAKILAWMAKHPTHSHDQWVERRKLADQGLCPACKPHRALTNGYRRCDVCRARSEASKARNARNRQHLHRPGPRREVLVPRKNDALKIHHHRARASA